MVRPLQQLVSMLRRQTQDIRFGEYLTSCPLARNAQVLQDVLAKRGEVA